MIRPRGKASRIYKNIFSLDSDTPKKRKEATPEDLLGKAIANEKATAPKGRAKEAKDMEDSFRSQLSQRTKKRGLNSKLLQSRSESLNMRPKNS